MTYRTSKRASPAEACRLVRQFRFAFSDAWKLAASNKRREAVAEHFSDWMSARIVAEQRCGVECLVTVEVRRPVAAALAEEYCRECPHYVRHSFAAASTTTVQRAL